MISDDILIFRTSVTTRKDIERIEVLFAQYFNIHKWSVDFEDWEKILRIESKRITAAQIIKLLRTIGLVASELELSLATMKLSGYRKYTSHKKIDRCIGHCIIGANHLCLLCLIGIFRSKPVWQCYFGHTFWNTIGKYRSSYLFLTTKICFFLPPGFRYEAR